MSRRKHLPQSRKWPVLSQHPEQAALLVNHPEWALLMEELRQFKNYLLERCPHAVEMVEVTEIRGQISVVDLLTGLAEDVEAWKS